MRLFDSGSGAPVIVVPGIQGRWEWMRPGIEALAEQCRVVTFSLCDEPCSGARFDEAAGFSCYVDQIRDALDQANLQRATICGVSFGGPIAAAFAAKYPSRTSALVLVSALSPHWTPNPRARTYLRSPRTHALLFLMGSVRRALPEVIAALPTWRDRIRFNLQSAARAVRYRPVAWRMGRRAQLLMRTEAPDLSTVRVPVLLVTGEETLDRAVPVTETRRYMELMPHARLTTLSRTGHLGIVTKPREFARVVTPFVQEHAA